MIFLRLKCIIRLNNICFNFQHAYMDSVVKLQITFYCWYSTSLYGQLIKFLLPTSFYYQLKCHCHPRMNYKNTNRCMYTFMHKHVYFKKEKCNYSGNMCVLDYFVQTRFKNSVSKEYLKYKMCHF